MIPAYVFALPSRPPGPSGAFASPVRLAAALALAMALAGCGRGHDDTTSAVVRPVRTTTVGAARHESAPAFTGRIEARDAVALSFRIPGRLSERLVGVGATVKDGQVLARLDPETELNELRSARAALAAAEGVLRQAEGRFERQSHLRDRGVTSQAEFEAAEQGRTSARAQVDAAAAKVRIAEDVVGFTEISADAPGIVTAIGVEPGEVVGAGQPVIRLARQDGRDAVFDIPAAMLDKLALGDRVALRGGWEQGRGTYGRVREISPEADPVTRLFRVRVGVVEPPAGMALGAAVQGTFALRGADGITLPAAAVLAGPEAAVFVVDPATGTLSLRPVTLERLDPALAIVAAGLGDGDVVVTAGVHGLKAGQKVRLAGGRP